MSAAAVLRLAARGDGVTEDGRFVPLTAPGDRVDDDGVVVPGPHHASPPCRHFPHCGGCQLQHVDDESYRLFLRDRIVEALAAQGLKPPELRPAHLSPPLARRRAGLRGERVGARVVLGFNERSSHRIIDLRECHVLRPELFALVGPLRRLLATLLAPRRQAEVRLTLTGQGVDLALAGVRVEGLAASEALTRFCEDHALARLTLDEGFGPETRWEPTEVTATLGEVPVAFPPAGFLQATQDGETALVAGVQEAIGGATAVADLFAGLGTFALSLAPAVRVVAVEGARDAAVALRSAANRAGRSLAVDHRDLFRRPLTVAELSRFEGVILDPPRAGAKEQMPALAGSPLARLSYVSCNPATFARDCRMLADGGWRIDWIRPVGQFRWSTHVELVAALRR